MSLMFGFSVDYWFSKDNYPSDLCGLEFTFFTSSTYDGPKKKTTKLARSGFHKHQCWLDFLGGMEWNTTQLYSGILSYAVEIKSPHPKMNIKPQNRWFVSMFFPFPRGPFQLPSVRGVTVVPKNPRIWWMNYPGSGSGGRFPWRRLETPRWRDGYLGKQWKVQFPFFGWPCSSRNVVSN